MPTKVTHRDQQLVLSPFYDSNNGQNEKNDPPCYPSTMKHQNFETHRETKYPKTITDLRNSDISYKTSD